MTYEEKINENKNSYPFERWRKSAQEYDMEQYTEANCLRAKSIMDELITELITIGEAASTDAKIEAIKNAVLKYNDLSEDVPDLIETGEREDLAEVINSLAVSIGIDLEEFDNDITQEWREW
jgi:hypothetical protein